MTCTMTKPLGLISGAKSCPQVFYPDTYRDSGGISSTGHEAIREIL
jgi:hypothetical protein